MTVEPTNPRRLEAQDMYNFVYVSQICFANFAIADGSAAGCQNRCKTYVFSLFSHEHRRCRSSPQAFPRSRDDREQ